MKPFFCIVLIAFLSYCGDEEDRQEIVNKLRGVGVKTTPSVFDKADVASLESQMEILLLLPKDLKVTNIENFKDPRSTFFLYTETQIDKDSETYTDIGGLVLYSIKAKTTIPTVNDTLLDAFNGAASIRYGIKVAAGSDEENIVGDLLFVKENSPASLWKGKLPTITILDPNDDSPLTEKTTISITANIDKPIDDLYKINWFASGGKIKNFRSTKTTWELPEKGEHTLFVSVHGTRSKTFNYAYKKITVE